MSGSSPDSPRGPAPGQRAYRSPRRSSPYSRSGHPRENLDPRGPGHAGDFDQFDPQFLPYNGRGGGTYQRTPLSFSSTANYDEPRRLPALTTIVNVDELSTEYGLDSGQRKAAHAFCTLSAEDRAVTLFLRILRMEQQNKVVLGEVQAVMAHVETIGAFCKGSWEPTKEQTKLLKSLLRHYIIRPLSSYTKLVSIVENYIHEHAKNLRLELYKHDPTVKAVVHEVLATENNSVRSALRKLVWTSVKDKTPLKTFSTKTMAGYHLAPIPTTPPQPIMACLALLREVARPLVPQETSRGGDTGFWTAVERELDTLFEKNGNSREDPKWLQWEQEIIAADDRRYLRLGAESNARTRQEIDAAMLAVSPDGDGPSGGDGTDTLLRGPAAPVAQT